MIGQPVDPLHEFAWVEATRYLGATAKNYGDDEVFVGVDPGSRNMGLAMISGSKLIGYQLCFMVGMAGVEEMTHYTFNLVKHILDTEMVAQRRLYGVKPGSAVIENASFGDSHGQALLGLARSAALLALWECKYRPALMPPSSIKKDIFGDGRHSAETIWKDHFMGTKHLDVAVATAAALVAAEDL